MFVGRGYTIVSYDYKCPSYIHKHVFKTYKKIKHFQSFFCQSFGNEILSWFCSLSTNYYCTYRGNISFWKFLSEYFWITRKFWRNVSLLLIVVYGSWWNNYMELSSKHTTLFKGLKISIFVVTIIITHIKPFHDG